MDTDLLKNILLTWDQAGDQPYEAIKEDGYEEALLSILASSKWIGKIYRGTHRHGELNIGDTLNYDHPTSWTTSMNIASNFVEYCDQKNIFILDQKEPINAIQNNYNTYGENEVIVNSISLKVIDKTIDGNYTFIYFKHILDNLNIV